MNCIFCKIIDGEIPAVKVVDEESVIAFMDINPASPGHMLVVPKSTPRISLKSRKMI